ncbi:hypothetical protein [Agaribacter flavus]|uniref:Methyl-accepting chemotaxis protein n=1 Tax=Agaribacter flavus TaxID=1902781 RepID=A0ABV7FPS4_9ALTE
MLEFFLKQAVFDGEVMLDLVRNITIKQRLIAAFAVIILMTLVMSSIQFFSVAKLGDIVDKMHRHPLTVTRASALAYANVLKAGLFVREAVNTTSSAASRSRAVRDLNNTQALIR